MTINNKNTESSQGDGGAAPPTPPPGQADNLSSRGGNTIFKSGPLFISSKGIGWTSWKKRWFILTRTSLVFFRSDPNSISQKGSEVNLTLGGIDLNNSGSVVVKADKKLLTVLFPDGRDGRAFTLKAETSEDLYEWKNALETALAQAPNAALVMGQNGIFKNDQVNGKDTPSDQCLLTDKPPAKSLVIGRPILLALEDVDGSPSFLEKALRFIEEHGVKVEGILRQAADVDDVEHRVREYEQGKTEFSSEEDAHIVADCVKYFLREMPSSPVPASCCNALLEARRTDRAGRVNAMRAAIYETFPEPNRRLLQRILSMMQKVAIHKAVNRMSTSAVAACMAPLLLRPLLSGDCEIETDFDVGGDGSIQLLQAAAAANHAQAIVITLLEEYDNIFREGSMTPGLYSDSEEDASEDEEVTDDDDDDDEFYEDDEHDDASELSDAYTDYDLDNASGGTCSESADSEEENLSNHEVHNELISGSESPEVENDSKDHQELPSSSIETSLLLHIDIERSTDILDQSNNNPGTQTNESGELVGDGSKETTLENKLTGSNPSVCIQKSASISNGAEHGTRRRTVWGRTAAKKNLSMESIDYALEDEVEIEKLEACKIDLQNKITKEVNSNAVLHANLEQRKKALHEHRQALEQDVARLQEQLQQERDKRTLLEAALNNSQEPLPVNLVVDEKLKAEFEEISQAEADIINLKQKVNDLNLQLNQQRDQNNGSTYDSRNQSNTSSRQAKLKDKNKDTEYATGSHSGRSSRKENHTDKAGSENDKKHESTSLQSKHSQQSDPGRNSNSRSSTNSRRSSRSEAMNSTTSALTKLTTRLNFLKERRTQIANELHNLDKGRSSNQSTAAADKGRASESRLSVQNVDKSQGSETSSASEKGLATEGQPSQNLDKSKKPDSQTHPDAQQTENVDAGRQEVHLSSHKDKVQGSGGKTAGTRRTNSR